MPALDFTEARRVVIETVAGRRAVPEIETAPLHDCGGRVLALDLPADRDYPALPRSVRDGYAVRAADLPGRFRIIGEVRAGARFEREVHPGQAVEIMTGAPVPAGADCVVMVEVCRVDGDRMTTEKVHAPGDHVDAAGSMAASGEIIARAGHRIGYRMIGMLAAAGYQRIPVFEKPRVAIVTTGDELVEIDTAPEPHQIRNSNAHSLAAQVRAAGGVPVIFPTARDQVDDTRDLILQALECHLLLLSGGVSAGRYDVVESALATLGVQVLFDRVRIQPGQPLVFGMYGHTPVFGLPGNPASTMVCFEVFARAALELLEGQKESILPITEAALGEPFRQKPGLTRFLPARLHPDGRTLSPVGWQGSGDVPALARANCLMVTDPLKSEYAAGDRIGVLLP